MAHINLITTARQIEHWRDAARLFMHLKKIWCTSVYVYVLHKLLKEVHSRFSYFDLYYVYIYIYVKCKREMERKRNSDNDFTMMKSVSSLDLLLANPMFPLFCSILVCLKGLIRNHSETLMVYPFWTLFKSW